MKIIIASGNKGKIKEFKQLLLDFDVVAFTDVIEDIDIIEDGKSFQENAIIKAKAIDEKLPKSHNWIIIADDSGISVPRLNYEPNIYSARYAGVNATDKQNNQKLIEKLNNKNIKQTSAFYTACIAIIINHQIYTVHGWMYGDVINREIGDDGFGYDPMFIPDGFDKTLGELDFKTKKHISHRTKALNLAKHIISMIK